MRHEKLPDFLNDILRQPENDSRGQKIPGYENPETLGPPVGMPIASAMEYERRTPTALPPPPKPATIPAPAAAYKSPVPTDIPAYENSELAYPGYENPFNDPITTNHSFPAPPLGSGRGTPAPTSTRSATPLTRKPSLSAISERSGGRSPNTQVEMRIAYRPPRREVGDSGSDWGGSQSVMPRRLI